MMAHGTDIVPDHFLTKVMILFGYFCNFDLHFPASIYTLKGKDHCSPPRNTHAQTLGVAIFFMALFNSLYLFFPSLDMGTVFLCQSVIFQA